MIAMQYNILLPDDYDMNTIRQRVASNGYKTDGFQDLVYKAYIIGESGHGSDKNEYAPLYLWRDHPGMNQFIFNGFYDHILASFGWQKIHIGVPYQFHIGDSFGNAKYVIRTDHEISPADKMQPLIRSHTVSGCVGGLLLYNPDTWKYSEFYFYDAYPKNLHPENVYQILHISL